jgi:hypothetical protein
VHLRAFRPRTAAQHRAAMQQVRCASAWRGGPDTTHAGQAPGAPGAPPHLCASWWPPRLHASTSSTSTPASHGGAGAVCLGSQAGGVFGLASSVCKGPAAAPKASTTHMWSRWWRAQCHWWRAAQRWARQQRRACVGVPRGPPHQARRWCWLAEVGVVSMAAVVLPFI